MIQGAGRGGGTEAELGACGRFTERSLEGAEFGDQSSEVNPSRIANLVSSATLLTLSLFMMFCR